MRSETSQSETMEPGQLSLILSSPSSTLGSSSPSEIFSDIEGSTSSGTDLDDDDSQSDEGNLNAEPTLGLRNANTIRILESDLLYVLREHLNIAAHLIPQIHRALNIELPRDTEGYYSTPFYEHTTNPSAQGPSPISSNGGLNPIPNAEPRKHERSSDEDDEDNGDGSKRPRQDSGEILGNFSGRISRRRPTFACHFHKLNPDKYGGRAWTDRKFRTCIGPGPTELRRLKYFSRFSRQITFPGLTWLKGSPQSTTQRPSMCQVLYHIQQHRRASHTSTFRKLFNAIPSTQGRHWWWAVG